jgi:hypothetical protein
MGRQLIFAALYLAISSVAFGQNVESASVRAPGPRAISKTEGRNILSAISSAISAVDADSDSETDCSHLVHEVYEQAGFPYDYASSRELYIGSANMSFTRVRTPQAGDLVVWRGHVGIVSDPKEHSFFSFTRTGPDTQFYDSPYWRSRGLARFYRYVTEKPSRAGRAFETKRRSDQGTLVSDRNPDNRPPSKPTRPAPMTGSARSSAAPGTRTW